MKFASMIAFKILILYSQIIFLAKRINENLTIIENLTPLI